MKKYGKKKNRIVTDDKLSRETKELIEERNKRAWNENKTKIEKMELQFLRRKVKYKIREDIKNYHEEKIKEVIGTYGSIKKTNNELITGRNVTIVLKDEGGEKIYNREGIVKIAMDFYKKLYSGKEEGNMKSIRIAITNRIEEEQANKEKEVPEVLTSEVRRILEKLKPGKMAGRDQIGNEMLKEFTSELMHPLKIILNETIKEEKIPYQWRAAEIILLFKKGNKEMINNYRPISLTSNISKIIKERIYNQLDENQGREQAGFRKDFSTIDQIFTINQLLEKAKEYIK